MVCESITLSARPHRLVVPECQAYGMIHGTLTGHIIDTVSDLVFLLSIVDTEYQLSLTPQLPVFDKCQILPGCHFKYCNTGMSHCEHQTAHPTLSHNTDSVSDMLFCFRLSILKAKPDTATTYLSVSKERILNHHQHRICSDHFVTEAAEVSQF